VPRKSSRRFDFDQWAALARDDPAGFEQQRRDRVDALILRASPAQRRRLRGLQFRIDMERRRAATPMAACVRIQAWMWDSLVGPDGFYERLGSGGRLVSLHGVPQRRQPEPRQPCAIVIPFPGQPRRPSE